MDSSVSGERWNLVSARVPSHFKRAIPNGLTTSMRRHSGMPLRLLPAPLSSPWRRSLSTFCWIKPKNDGKQARSPCGYSERVPAALVIQHTMRMHRFILPSAACLALPHFSTLSHKRHDSSEGGGRTYSTRNACFDSLSNFSTHFWFQEEFLV